MKPFDLIAGGKSASAAPLPGKNRFKEIGIQMLRLWPLLLWLVYFILPYDLFPDFLPGIGWTEDLLILGIIYWIWRKRQQKRSAETSDYYAYQQNTAGRNESERAESRNRNNTGSRSKSEEKARDPYKILGIARPAKLEDIKRAYRLQANRYHPDKVSHLGEEFQALAKEKFQDIQWAYEQLLKQDRV